MPWSGWGIPIIIPEPPGAPTEPAPFDALVYNPIGLYDLRRRLGVLRGAPGVFARYQSKFLASDVAWLAAGYHTDGNHYPSPGQFDSLFSVARQGTSTSGERAAQRKQLRDLLFDLATMGDRAFGGCTMILHMDGTTQPNAPALPEYLKAHVYIPPIFLRKNPECHPVVAQMVQQFIEEIGVRTVMRFKTAARATLGWRFTQESSQPLPNQAGLPLIPNPTPAMSSHYLFYGRPYKDVDLGDRASPPPSVAPQNNSHDHHHHHHRQDTSNNSSDDDDWDVETNTSEDTGIDYRVENGELQRALEKAKKDQAESQRVIRTLRDEISILSLRLSDALRDLAAAGHWDPEPARRPVPKLPPQQGPPSPKKSGYTQLPKASEASTSRRSTSPHKSDRQPNLGGTAATFSYSPRSRREEPRTGPQTLTPPLLQSGPSSLSRPPPIRSFGPATAAFLRQHQLSPRLHCLLARLHADVALEDWAHELISELGERHQLADGLIAAALEDCR